MADRVVKVTLRAQVAEYNAGMEKAARATREVGTEAEKLAQKREAFDQLGKASLAVGTLAAAGVALAVKKYAEFDQAMSEVKADTQETVENMGLLREAALDAGASTVFSATESANAIDELGKAGLTTADILGGALAGSLDLASAGGLGVARAAEITATALQQYNLEGTEATHVSDVLAAGAGKAMGSVEDLANGLKFVGPVANSMGVSLEETTGTLAMFAQQGIIGEQAGTSLRGVLSSLTSPSSIARKEIERLGLTLYDAQGNFLGLENAAGQLSGAYSDMDGASRDASLGVIFGRETVTAATTLYRNGAEGVAEWTAAVDDTGYAAKVAADKLDNLMGDVEGLGGAFDTALIGSGSAANEVLRFIVQSATDMLDLFNDAPEGVQAVALGIGAVAAAAGLAGGAFFLLNPKVQTFKASLETMGPKAQKAGAMLTGSFGGVAAIMTVATVGLAAFASAQAEAKARVQSFTDTLNVQTGAVTSSTRDLISSQFAAKGSFLWMEQSSVFDDAKTLGLSLEAVTDAAMGNADAMAELEPRLGGGAQSMEELIAAADAAGMEFDEYVATQGRVKSALEDTDSEIGKAREALLAKKEADEKAAQATYEHENALAKLEGVANGASESIDDLASAIKGFGSANLDVRSTARELEAAIDGLSASVAKNGKTLDVGTDAGRSNEAALDAIAQKALNSAAAVAIQTNSQEEATAAILGGRDSLIDALGQFGITGQAAEDYADKLGLIPKNIDQYVNLNTDAATRQINDWLSIQNGKSIHIAVGAGGAGGLTKADGGIVSYYGNGGVRRESHVAEIAPAGAWRVWAEPETGGEAYIPLAPAKRARSLQIYEEVGRQLGVNRYADGAVVAPRYASLPAVTAGGAGGGGGRPISVTQQIYATPGMSAEQVGQIAASKIETVLKGMN